LRDLLKRSVILWFQFRLAPQLNLSMQALQPQLRCSM